MCLQYNLAFSLEEAPTLSRDSSRHFKMGRNIWFIVKPRLFLKSPGRHLAKIDIKDTEAYEIEKGRNRDNTDII